MKKLFTLFAAAVMALAANAQTFTGKLSVEVNGSAPLEQDVTILVEKYDGVENLYTITLKDFSFPMVGTLGDIKIDDVNGEIDDAGIVILSKDGVTTVHLTIGDADVTLNEGCKIDGDKLFMDMSISAIMGMISVEAQFEGASTSTGIEHVTTPDNGEEAIYDLSGRRLNEMQKGINIVRKADGTTVKVLKK